MKISTLSRLAFKHTKNAAAEAIYLQTGIDRTRPTTFYGLVNERCNVKCRYCEYWRLPKYRQEMSIEEWQSALLSIREFVGEYSISFSGGEPFIKPGFVDLLRFCGENGIHAGVTTNGSALNERNAEKTVLARPFNVNISCDAPDAKLHDYLRGSDGLFDKLTNGLKYLRRYQKQHGIDFPIIIKPTIESRNFRVLPALVRWAEEIGATAVNMQPMDRWTPETYDELWIEEPDHEDLQGIIDELLAMKRRGAPIMNSDEGLRLWVRHFREESAPPEVMPCRVGMRDFFIRPDGKIEVCFYYPPIGNIREASAREIWYGEAAEGIRRQTVECDKLCLHTCLSQKSLTDKVKMGLKLVGGRI